MGIFDNDSLSLLNRLGNKGPATKASVDESSAPGGAASAGAPAMVAAPQTSLPEAAAAPAPDTAAPQAPEPDPMIAPSEGIFKGSDLSMLRNVKGAEGTSDEYRSRVAGMTPMNPIPESPLGIMDRARLGWAKTPAAQKNLLESKFGADNVKLEGGEFIVKQDGKWRQVDPAFSWNMSGGMSDIGGDIGQFAGQYGLKSVAAARGGVAGFQAGAVAGPWGMAAGTLIGAGLGAVAEDSVENVGRLAANKLGYGDAASLPQNSEEVAKQSVASFLFGAEQELGGRIAHGLGTGTVKALSGTLKRLGATPEGKQLASKLLSVVSGRPEIESRIRVEDPTAIVPYDLQARNDALHNTDTLYSKMKGMVQDTFDTFKGKLRSIGKEYEPIEEVAHTLDYQPQDAVTGTLNELNSNGYIKDGKVVNYEASGGVERGISASEQGVLKYTVTQLNNIARKLNAGDSVSYREMQNVISTIDSRLSDHGASIADGNLRRILTKFRADLKTNLVATLHEADPDMAKAYTTLNSKYGPAKELMEHLASKTDDQRVDAFIGKVLKADGKFDSELMTSLSNTLGTADPTPDLLRAHVARNSTEFWGGGRKFFGVPVGTPRLAAGIAEEVSTARQSAKSLVDAIPYMNHALSSIKSAGEPLRNALYSNPAALEDVARTVMGGVVGEKQMTNQLLESGGVTGADSK